VADLFPERPVTLRGLGRTYSLMNLLSPWIGGIPMCHGCGGLAGYYALGARTGGSVVIYGSLYLVIGIFFSGAFQEVLRAFPAPVLGAVLLVEAGVLLLLLRDLVRTPRDLALAAVVALICVFAPQGYFTGMIAGCGLFHISRRLRPAPAAAPTGAPG
jgi:MFS superfamily sulfate permease-like transporter